MTDIYGTPGNGHPSHGDIRPFKRLYIYGTPGNGHPSHGDIRPFKRLYIYGTPGNGHPSHGDIRPFKRLYIYEVIRLTSHEQHFFSQKLKFRVLLFGSAL